MKNVTLAFGTRPEATKMSPVYHEIRKNENIKTSILLTGQHREQLAHALSLFDITPDVNLDVMTEEQSPPELAARLLPRVAKQLNLLNSDYVLVHGDTLTTFVVAWAAFLEEIPVGHVEAGLRSFNLKEPFPEEANRRLTDTLTDLDFAPTSLACQNLIDEGKDPENILVTGQTGVDAVLYASRVSSPPDVVSGRRTVTVTMHRRENWPVLGELASALARVAKSNPEYTFVYPVHLNPVVQRAVKPVLKKIDNFILMDPIEYGSMAGLLGQSDLIITDSGGLQEEGAALNVPVVVVRNITERPEGIDSGILRIAGTEPEDVYQVSNEILNNRKKMEEMKKSNNPYGDGYASRRVAEGVAWRLGLGQRPNDWKKKITSYQGSLLVKR